MPRSDARFDPRRLGELQDLTVSGILSLDGEGKIVTDSDTGALRVIISSTNSGYIAFHTGSSTAAYPGLVYAFGPAGANPAFLEIVAPSSAALRPLINMSKFGVYVWDSDGTLQLGMSTAGVSVPNTLTAGSVIVGSAVNGPAASTYAPTFGVLSGTTLPSVGTGANAAKQGVYSRMGPQVTANVTIKWSSNGSAGNGTYKITPPKSIHSGIPIGASVGGGRINDASANDSWLVDCRKAGTTSINLRYNTTGTPNVTNSVPFTFGSSNDEIQLHLTYLTTET